MQRYVHVNGFFVTRDRLRDELIDHVASQPEPADTFALTIA